MDAFAVDSAQASFFKSNLFQQTDCWINSDLSFKVPQHSDLIAQTECGEVEDVITVVNTKPYTDKQKARIKRKQLHLLMKERLDEFKEIDTFRKIADKDPAFRTLYEAYKKQSYQMMSNLHVMM